MACYTKVFAALLLASVIMQLQCAGAVAARVLTQKAEPKEPKEPSGIAKSIDESGFFKRLESGGDDAATDGGDRRKMLSYTMPAAGVLGQSYRHLLQKAEPKEPKEPSGIAKSIDESGFFKRLELGADDAATDGGDRRKLLSRALPTVGVAGPSRRHLMQKAEPKEPKEPSGIAKSIDESGFFKRLESGGDEPATDGGDRRKML